ncbi:hypothetical protein [Microlunatus sp. GCM10028923]|uniref:hypothetical protein n=1 Tax=Microlunatus sp. GCM10028923 TaxID=3273400 RepID=UPI003613B65B
MPDGINRAAYIGDWYLSTGHPSDWKQLGLRYLGTGSGGTCDVMNVRPPGDA